MAVILTPDKWRRQPSGPVAIDYSHPAAPGLVHLTLPSVELIDLASGGQWEQWSGPNAVARTAGSGGNAWKPSGSTNSFIYRADSAANSVSKIIAVSVVETAAGIGDYAPLTKRVYFDKGWMLNVRFSGLKGNDYPCLAFFDGVGWRSTTGTRDIRGTGPRTLVGSYDGATLRCFVDGISDGETAFAGSIPDTAGRVEAVGYGENSTVGLVYGSYLIDATKVNASAELVREISRAPYAIFRKQPRILYFTAPSGGGATIAGDLESLTLSTFGATVGSARAVAAALESLALTTSAARVSSDRAITASVESISLTTSPARIASDRAVAAATEQLTVTPATASVALVSGIAAGTEALSVTANPATVALAASIAATLEAITVTGLTATVSTSSNTNISAALESITVTVNPATVSRDSALAAALESLTVTPHAASIAVGQIVAAALEGLMLTSYPAGIALDVAIAAQLEQINLATFAAQVGLGTNVAALTEALTLTPHGATLTFAPSVGAATEHLTLTTFAAVVGATEAALLSPGLEFTIPLSRMGYTIPVSRVHFTIPQE